MAGAVQWITASLLGSIALALCVLAVASVGLMMLAGRLPVRRGLSVVLGCFVLLGAPVIASAFVAGTQEAIEAPVPAVIERSDLPPRKDLPPANYDPYAGASLRRD